MDIVYPAHIRIDPDGTEHVQSVWEHCAGAAEIARRSLEPARLGCAARLAALVHDIGKYTEKYADYLTMQVHDPAHAPARGSVNHTFAAVRFILERWHEQDAIAAELLAFAAGAHHGLFDLTNERGESGFHHRMSDKTIHYAEAKAAFAETICPAELDRLANEAFGEIAALVGSIVENSNRMEDDGRLGDGFYAGNAAYMGVGLAARLLLSAVMDGDRSDTAAFMAGRPVSISTDDMRPQHLADNPSLSAVSAPPDDMHPQHMADNPSLSAVSVPTDDMRPLWRSGLAALEDRLASFRIRTPVDALRAEVSEKCAAAGREQGGVVRLTLPTGAGKTLSSLRYALEHALKWNKRRIFYVMPLLAIIDQNAAELRKALGGSIPVLEHHSNLVQSGLTADELDERELLCESWHAPLIVTTLVQFLQTLFSGKTGCIRRFQALCGSVIVIDEVQTVPTNMLSLFNAAIRFLADHCGATVVLCSATQPALDAVRFPLCGARDLIAEDMSLRPELRRTLICDAGSMTLSELAAHAQDILQKSDTLLIICNKKTQARELYRMLQQSGCPALHLSAAMCMAHRRDALSSIMRMQPGQKLVCISTQVMEAGVDVSFRHVIRVSAGMDSIVQAAGRCNRHGECPQPQQVEIVRLADENLQRLREIERAKNATARLLNRFHADPTAFRGDLSSSEAIGAYYRELFGELQKFAHHTEYPVDDQSHDLFDLLSLNEHFLREEDGFALHQAFKYAGERFTVFDSDTIDAVTPFGEGKSIIAALSDPYLKYDHARAAELLEKAKPYTIGLYRYEADALRNCGGLRAAGPMEIHCIGEDFYSGDTGLDISRCAAYQSEFWEG